MDDTPSLLTIIINWLPFFVTVAATIYVAHCINRYRRDRAASSKVLLEQLQRQTLALEKLVAQIEKRSQ